MLISDCKPYEWYFVVTCPACKTKQGIFNDPSKGKARIRHTYKHRCDKCSTEEYYEPEDIERYHHVVERRKNPRT